ncbi:hypothetical protein L873DRAFT_1579608, partial [Choiromyces venosus 120613-1]
TVNYLAYGSNLASATLTSSRKIHPLRITPVRVPGLTLTFNLPGIPYLEPCFANVRLRSTQSGEEEEEGRELVGVVYEITRSDYDRLFASEGAGAAYQEYSVSCIPLGAAGGCEEVIARTLLCPEHTEALTRWTGQPSLRYLDLLRSGARERALPGEYVEYLDGLQGYRVTTLRQRVGRGFVLAVWAPAFLLTLVLNRVFAGEDGRAPGWAVGYGRWVTKTVWGSYDRCYKVVFGSGECTEGEE